MAQSAIPRIGIIQNFRLRYLKLGKIMSAIYLTRLIPTNVKLECKNGVVMDHEVKQSGCFDSLLLYYPRSFTKPGLIA